MNPKSLATMNSRRRWVVALAAIGLFHWFVGDLQAASMSQAARHGDEAAHSCKCGPRCRGAACCCLPKSSEKPARAAEALDASIEFEPTETDDGPCFAAACGDPVGPTSGSVGPTKSGVVIGRLRARWDDRGALLALPSSPRAPARLASRLERPPKADASA